MRPEQYQSNTTASLRAFHSLSAAQASELELGMSRVPGTWEIDRQEGYDGHLTLVISSADTTCDALFAVWRSGAELQMSTMRGDEQVTVQSFSSVKAVLLAIQSSIDQVAAPFLARAQTRLL
ncbi:hypothetical protein EAH89_24865 [Roseomonas nepalensis]|uniref:Uncharacterized protein n=1 Tax=Muricoccus nepalensis TaxID=1854500 RepID=A0A502FAK2_9PROT|nr:hypothetical protein [Roseomonas nepalensis]TPG46445.1 hypothetical protein EAH89_24865 [Roseomonas nepalensis]